ncbi:MAG: MotA/TolQ/ExbB proton channel family protein [Planctomycetota bacterium]|nr:MotA/TolQ/ExbB proton channel family protein [Planctomycetota bacterium]
MSLTEVVIKFTHLGSEWVMWVLVILSIISVTVMIERALFFRRHRVGSEQLSAALERHLRAGDLSAAARLVDDSPAIECVVAAAGLNYFSRSANAVSEAMQSAKAREKLKLEAYLSVLATLGNNAPFIGLLGTVIGIIKASQDLAAAQAAKQVGTAAVMSGVFEALVATAVGLFVAIPAVIAYNYFQRRVREALGRVDSIAHLMLALYCPVAGAEARVEVKAHQPAGVN